MENSIKTSSLSVGYDGNIIIPDFNIDFLKGKITSIIGPNGCGKSTILKAMGRILKANKGDVFILDKNIKNLNTKDIAKMMSILPQSPQVNGSVSCFELVSYGRYPYQKGFGKLSNEDKEIINWALSVTNMSEYKTRPIMSLSGGQRQRVWIAMCLAQQTGIILLDEPTTYLDLCHQLEVLELLKYLNKTQKTTIIMVLHDLNLASKYSDYLLSMKDGTVYSYGSPSEVFTKEMLLDCFNIVGEIELDKKSNKPLCVSYELKGNKYEDKK